MLTVSIPLTLWEWYVPSWLRQAQRWGWGGQEDDHLWPGKKKHPRNKIVGRGYLPSFCWVFLFSPPKRILTSMVFLPQDAFNFWLIESDYKSNLFNVNRNPVRLQPSTWVTLLIKFLIYQLLSLSQSLLFSVSPCQIALVSSPSWLPKTELSWMNSPPTSGSPWCSSLGDQFTLTWSASWPIRPHLVRDTSVHDTLLVIFCNVSLLLKYPFQSMRHWFWH